MSTTPKRSRRALLLKALSTLLLLSALSGALYLTQGSYLPALRAWFMLDEPAHLPAHPPTHTYTLSASQVSALKLTFEATERLRVALSEDQVIRDSALFEQARAGLTSLLNQPHTKAALSALTTQALEALKASVKAHLESAESDEQV